MLSKQVVDWCSELQKEIREERYICSENWSEIKLQD